MVSHLFFFLLGISRADDLLTAQCEANCMWELELRLQVSELPLGLLFFIVLIGGALGREGTAPLSLSRHAPTMPLEALEGRVTAGSGKASAVH